MSIIMQDDLSIVGEDVIDYSKDWATRVRVTDTQINNFLNNILKDRAVQTLEHDVQEQHGKMLKLINYDTLFYNSDGAKIINSDIMMSSNLAYEINEAIMTNSDGDLGFTATCSCGKFVGNHYTGATCPLCKTVVSTSFADKLAHTCWVGIPDDMPPLMHPIVYLVLSKWSTFKLHGVPLIDTLLDPSLEMPDDLKEIIPKQGFTYFTQHFDEIMDYLFNVYPKTATKSNTPMTKLFIKRYRDLVFCRKIPILHSSLHIAAKTGSIRLVDNSVKDALKTVLNITYASFSHRRSVTHDKYIDVSIYKAFKGYIEYISSIGQHKLGDKFALFRHHILGCRCHWSQRCVIVPMCDPVMADEVYIPWKVGVKSFKLEILNVMVNNYGMDPEAVILRHDRALSSYDELVDRILEGLIASHPFGGLPVLLGRNPDQTRIC